MTNRKFSDTERAQKQDRYLGCLRKGMRRGKAARAAGVDRGTILLWQEKDSAFANECVRAEADYCDEVEKCLLKSCKKLNTTAMIFWLTNRSAERWKDRRATPTIITPAKDESNADVLQKLQSLLKEESARDIPPGPQEQKPGDTPAGPTTGPEPTLPG